VEIIMLWPKQEESPLLDWRDEGRHFMFGNTDSLWRVEQIFDNSVVCKLLVSEDIALFPTEMVHELLRDHEEYWSLMYAR
jgi:hypothetical protein